MGIGFHKSSFCSCDHKTKIIEKIVEVPVAKLPNPNPNNYIILDSKQLGKHLVVKIKYPDCINYEGIKILLYLNIKLKDIQDNSIDPHFCEYHLSPFARFEPTNMGWKVAISLAKTLNSQII